MDLYIEIHDQNKIRVPVNSVATECIEMNACGTDYFLAPQPCTVPLSSRYYDDYISSMKEKKSTTILVPP